MIPIMRRMREKQRKKIICNIIKKINKITPC